MPKVASPKSALSKIKNPIRLGSILGVALFLFLAYLWIQPKVASLSITATPSAIPATATAIATSTATPISYIIQEGDSLDSIAQKFDLGEEGILLLYYENRTVIEALDGLIFPGQTIKIPPAGSALPTPTAVPDDLLRGTIVEHRVLPGDQLEDIAQQYHTTQEDIIAANPDIAENPDTLNVGEILQIPVNLVTPTATQAP